MQLIDRYILKLFLLYLSAGVLVFVTLYLTVDVMSFALRYADAGTGSLLRYYAYHTPWIVDHLLPVACLVSRKLCASATCTQRSRRGSLAR
jgi:lipopolysaccharide export LptBFGC system permease protein LptF